MANTAENVNEEHEGREGAYFKNQDEETFFFEWFWKGSNGNDLIKKLNVYAQGKKLDDRIRREKESPAIYAVVLKDDPFPSKVNREQWKLCKIGFTHRSIKRGTNYRMEQVEKDVEKRYNTKKKEQDPNADDAEASTLFVLRIGAVDTTSYYEKEKRIREKVGKPVRKEKAKELNLPIPTEWVLTTQKHIDEIKKKIDERNGCQADAVDLNIFKEIKTTPTPPDEKRMEWLMEDKDEQKPQSSSAKKEKGKYSDKKSSGQVEKERNERRSPHQDLKQDLPQAVSGNVEKNGKRKAKSSTSSLAATFSPQAGSEERAECKHPQDK